MRAYEFPPGPMNSPGFLLWHVTRRWQSMLGERLEPLGLTPAQFLVLGSLGWIVATEGAPPTQRELAEHAGTDPMMTSQLLRVLEERGWVVRSPDEEDARAMRVRPTQAGETVTRHAVAAVRGLDEELFDANIRRDALLPILRGLAAAAGAPAHVVADAAVHTKKKKRRKP